MHPGFALLLLIGSTIAAGAQSLSQGRPVTELSTGLPTSSPDPNLLPLTASERGDLQRRLGEYRARLLAEAPREDALMRAGLSAEIDAVEQARRMPDGSIGHVGVLQPLAAPPGLELDPAIAIGAREKLVRRLGREPTRAELDGEIRAFDVGIDSANRTGSLIAAPTGPSVALSPRARHGMNAVGGMETADGRAVQAFLLSLIRSALQDQQ
jgi:hypothetical protein